MRSPQQLAKQPGRRTCAGLRVTVRLDMHESESKHCPSLNNSARREKALCHLRVQVPPGELSVHPGSYRGGKKGNRLAEALGTTAHRGWVCEPTGRNTCEARAGLESEGVSADPPE